MADVGLGYSQLAPVAIQLWAAQNLKRSSQAFNRGRALRFDWRDAAGSLVVVEQPELHLHPAFQARLADVFVRCVKDGAAVGPGVEVRPALRLMAETHSPNLISRLGELVGEGEVASGSVNVWVFEPDINLPGATQIRTAKFDDKGVLQNWPIGFFDA